MPGFRTENGSFLFGFDRDGVFFPSHFSPSSLRDGTELLRTVSADAKSVVFAVTPDLTNMMERLNFTKMMSGFPQPFGGEVVFKDIVANNAAQSLFKNGTMPLLKSMNKFNVGGKMFNAGWCFNRLKRRTGLK